MRKLLLVDVASLHPRSGLAVTCLEETLACQAKEGPDHTGCGAVWDLAVTCLVEFCVTRQGRARIPKIRRCLGSGTQFDSFQLESCCPYSISAAYNPFRNWDSGAFDGWSKPGQGSFACVWTTSSALARLRPSGHLEIPLELQQECDSSLGSKLVDSKALSSSCCCTKR